MKGEKENITFIGWIAVDATNKETIWLKSVHVGKGHCVCWLGLSESIVNL